MRPVRRRAAPQGGLTFLRASERHWSMLSNVAAFLGVFGWIGTAVAGGWALFEYYEGKEKERTEATLILVEKWETGDYRTAYGELRKAYEDFIGQVPSAEMEAAASSELARRNILRNFNLRMEKDVAQRERIEKVVYFFNRVSLCEKARLCSRQATAVFFDDTIRSFIDVFGPYIASNAGTLPGAGVTLKELSDELNAHDGR